jgi:hypothetical protein
MTKFNTLKISFITLIALACYASTSHAVPQSTIDPGWSLYQTSNTVTLAGLQFIGDPIGEYNFGGSIGTQNVGDTDTIIQHAGTITASGALPQTPAASPIQMTDLQLETIAPSSAFGPLAFYFVTLEPSTPSTGLLTATFDTPTNGTYDSSIDMFYDIHQGSLTGPVVFSSDVTITTSNAFWQRLPTDPSDVIISGVNSNLNAVNTGSDFWNTGIITNSGVNYSQELAPAVVAVPEPSALALAALGVSGVLFLFRKRK